MQVKLFTIPLMGGERLEDELNVFLRSRKILQVEQQIVHSGGAAFWTFCVRYLENSGNVTKSSQSKIEYKDLLGSEAFERFSKYRVIRKRVAEEDGVPAYAVFTDEELAELAKIKELSASSVQEIKGIGSRKIEKYLAFFLEIKENETKG